MKRLVLVAILLAGCSKKSDYSDAKLVTQTVAAPGVTYTIDIPDGLPKDKRDAGNWDDAREEYDHIPKVFTGIYVLEMPTSLEEAKREVPLSPDKGTFVRADQKPDGWVMTITTDDKKRIEASSLKKVGGKLVHCHAVQIGDGEIANYDKTKTMLETICDSIKAK